MKKLINDYSKQTWQDRLTDCLDDEEYSEALALMIEHKEEIETIAECVFAAIARVDKFYEDRDEMPSCVPKHESEWQDKHQPVEMGTQPLRIVSVDEDKGTVIEYFPFPPAKMLTQEQYEKAWKALATPQPKFKPGDKVRVTKKMRKYIKDFSWDEEILKSDAGIVTISEISGCELHNYYDIIKQPVYLLKEDMGNYEYPEDCLELVDDKAQKLQEWCDRQPPIGQNPDDIAKEIHDRELFDKYKHLFWHMVLIEENGTVNYFRDGAWGNYLSSFEHLLTHTKWVYNPEWGDDEFYDFKISESTRIYYDKTNNQIIEEKIVGDGIIHKEICTLNPDKLRY